MADETQLTIRRPDDWHVHLRDGAMLAAVLPFTARQFARAIVMPNLEQPVTTAAAAADYRRRILQALPEGDAEAAKFLPLMTCYLTDETDAAALEEGFIDGVFTAAKLYPANATTNSAAGVTDPLALRAVYEKMQTIGMPLLIHGEVTDTDVDIFDREAVFIERTLNPLVRDFPRTARGAGTCHHQTSGGVRTSARRVHCCHHHGASSDHQSQRHFRWRHPAARLLPARGEARGAPVGPAGGGDIRGAVVLPRHRFGGASRDRQGGGMRLCRSFHGAGGACALRARI